MDEVKELLGKIQIISDKPLESFLEYLENGSAKFKEFVSLLRDISLKLKHLREIEMTAFEEVQGRRITEGQKANSERVTYSSELAKLRKEVADQEGMKEKNARQVGALEAQIDGLTQLYDKKKTDYDELIEKIERIKNPLIFIGNTHEERYRPKP